MPNGYIKSKEGTPIELVDAEARRQLANKLSGVKVAGTELTPDDNGVIDIPLASQSEKGVVALDYQYSFIKTHDGVTYLNSSSPTSSRTLAIAKYRAVTFANVDAIILASLTDDVSVDLWTEEKQLAGRTRLGITDEYINNLIDAKLGVIENGSY